MGVPATSDVLSSIAARLVGHTYRPTPPRSLDETGLTEALIDSRMCKELAAAGNASGRTLADNVALPFAIVEERLQCLRTRQLMTHRGAAPLNDYVYSLTEQGREYTMRLTESCAYRGPAPCLFPITSTRSTPRRLPLKQLSASSSKTRFAISRSTPFCSISSGQPSTPVPVCSLYGSPGNGKTTLAERITLCFGQELWIPKALIVEGEIVKFFDEAYHVPVVKPGDRLMRNEVNDRRWVLIGRPTVIVGGERRWTSLEPPQPAHAHQRSTAAVEKQLWIAAHRRLRPATDEPRGIAESLDRAARETARLLDAGLGQKIQVPFDQLIIFSTNLDPTEGAKRRRVSAPHTVQNLRSRSG